RELTRTAGADAARLRDRVQGTTGLDLEKDLIPSFAGNIGIGVYLDASSLIEAVLGEQVGSFDRSAFVVAAQLANPQTVRAALDRAMRARPAVDRAQLNGASWFRLGDGAQAAVRDDVLFVAIGGTPPPEKEAPGAPRARKAASPAKEHGCSRNGRPICATRSSRRGLARKALTRTSGSASFPPGKAPESEPASNAREEGPCPRGSGREVTACATTLTIVSRTARR